MVDIIYRPIERWPGPLTEERSASRFTAEFDDTKAALQYEVSRLRTVEPVVEEIIIQLAVPEGAVRQDGALRRGAKPPSHPGVIVSFETDLGSLQFACDRFDAPSWRSTAGWKHNLRAVTLGLEALRTVDRYGISSSAEQYRGFQALPSGDEPEQTSITSFVEAVTFVSRLADCSSDIDRIVAGDREVFASVYRQAARAAHPDSPRRRYRPVRRAPGCGSDCDRANRHDLSEEHSTSSRFSVLCR